MNLLKQSRLPLSTLGLALASAVAAFLAGCTSTALPPAPPPAPQPPAIVIAPPVVAPSLVSQAGNPRDYRRDAASHLYGKNADRIYRGKMPPTTGAG